MLLVQLGFIAYNAKPTTAAVKYYSVKKWKLYYDTNKGKKCIV
jgi:hypothetical protein